jgi:hypothetical protein
MQAKQIAIALSLGVILAPLGARAQSRAAIAYNYTSVHITQLGPGFPNNALCYDEMDANCLNTTLRVNTGRILAAMGSQRTNFLLFGRIVMHNSD